MYLNRLSLAVILATGVAASAPAYSAEVIGQVESLSVWAYGTPPDEPRRDLRPRSDVHAKELIETVRSAELLIEFADGTTLALAGDSTVMLDELVYDTGAGDSMVLNISQGFFNFVTGDINPDAVTIKTPSMVIGIRGTDLAIGVDDNGSTELGVRDGAATATPAAGGGTVEVATGETARADVGDHSVSVAAGLSSSARGAMPGSDGRSNGRGRGGGGDASHGGSGSGGDNGND